MAKITTISPEQIARFGEWTQKWTEIGLSTEPADFDKATEAALRGYQFANLKRPMAILRMSSPFGATMGGALAWMMLRAIFGKEVWAQVGAQVRAQVGAQVRAQVWDQVWAQVRDQVGDQVWDQVRDQVWDQAYRNSYHGAFWANWVAFVSFFRDVMNWNDPVLDRFEIEESLVRSCGWTWWHENVLAISDRPQLISRDAQGRLHRANGMAIAYRDGWGFHAWHGLRVPAEILDRAEFSADAIDAQSNAELRRVMLEREYNGRTGFELYLKVRQARIVAEDELHGQPRRLIEVKVGTTPLRIIEVRNGSLEPDGTRRRFHLGAMRGDTPHEVIAASYGIAPKHYREAVRS